MEQSRPNVDPLADAGAGTRADVQALLERLGLIDQAQVALRRAEIASLIAHMETELRDALDALIPQLRGATEAEFQEAVGPVCRAYWARFHERAAALTGMEKKQCPTPRLPRRVA